MVTTTEINTLPMGQAIYDRLCRDLVRGVLRPDQKVTIRGLAAALGTSSTPVRDAVQRLLQDGALEQRTMRDVRVPVLTCAQYLEVSRIRSELEGLAAGEAAAQAGPRDIARLRRLIHRNEDAIAATQWNKAAQYNQEFHFALAEVAGMPVLHEVLTRLWLRMGPLIAGYYSRAEEDMVQKHHAIVAACERRDTAAATAAMRDDIADARGGITAYIKALRPPEKAPAKGRKESGEGRVSIA